MLKDFFPFPEIRPAQEKALQVIEKGIESGKRVTILELPTGVGKSGIAIAAARQAETNEEISEYAPGAFLLVPNKYLQTQYVNDFSALGLVELKGKVNYQCECFKVDCATGGYLAKHPQGKKTEEEWSDHLAHLNCGTSCAYKVAKRTFTNSAMGVTNFSYFLTETMFVGQLNSRKLLVIDEAHNAEREILGFSDISIYSGRAESLGLTLPVILVGQGDKAKEWLEKYKIAVAKRIDSLMFEVKGCRINKEYTEAVELVKKVEAWERQQKRIAVYLESKHPEDWIVYTDYKGENLLVRPLTANLFADDFLFSKGEHVILLSATILDYKTYTRNLGLSPNECTYLRMQSDFPVENRPIYVRPQGDMSYNCIDSTLPNMLDYVDKILDKFKSSKGIIHSHSYKIQQAIIKRFKGTHHWRRIITHTSSVGDRDRAMRDHLSSEEPTVLVSPSMTEGIDLKDDLSRFQIIMKVPYPALDTYTKARLNRDQVWYSWCTALALVQATGRSNRHRDDRSVTFILDGGFESFLHRNSQLFPKWWTDALVF